MSIDSILQTTFGFPAFREHQRDIIEHICSDAATGTDATTGTLVVMPTGGGKSLLYQIPALMGSELSIVVSPLISLMKDQVDALCAKGVRAACVNSSMTAVEQIAVRDAVLAKRIQILYVAPERFKNENFMTVILQQQINILAVDEAHCISHWGSGFRPAYRAIPQAIKRIAPRKIIALTATANKSTQKDIVDNLGMPQAKVFVTGFARDDLHFAGYNMHGLAYAETRDAVLNIYDPEDGVDCGIVYFNTKKNCEKLVEDLKRWNIPVYVYHGGLPDKEKDLIQERWMKDNGVMIATTAFGMGIDKPNVRFVINGGIPSNVEEWYQMIGRGSRDGQGCDCYLFSDAEDLRIKHFLIETQYPEVMHLKKFKLWVDRITEDEDQTMSITQSAMAAKAGIPSHAASGCCGFLARLDVLEKVKPGVWTFHHMPDLDIDYSEHRKRIQEKKDDIERVRKIAHGGQVLADMCAYLGGQ